MTRGVGEDAAYEGPLVSPLHLWLLEELLLLPGTQVALVSAVVQLESGDWGPSVPGDSPHHGGEHGIGVHG